MPTLFESFVNLELPRRPALLTPNTTAFDGDPNLGPVIFTSAPTGTLYLNSTASLWFKATAGASGWNPFIGDVIILDYSQGATGALAPLTATLIGGADATGVLQPVTISSGALVVHLDSSGVLGVSGTGVFQVQGTVDVSSITGSVGVSNFPVTQSVFVVNSQGADVNITGSIPLSATVTGVVHVDNDLADLTASVSNFPAVQTVSGSGVFMVTGTVHLDNNLTASVSVSNLHLTQTIAGTVNISSITGAVAISNFPGSQNVVVTNTPPVTVANFPATQDVHVTNTASITGTVHVDNTILAVSQTNTPATQTIAGDVTISGDPKIDVVPSSPNATLYLPVRLTDGNAFYVATGGSGSGGSGSAQTIFIPPITRPTSSQIFLVPQTSSVVTLLGADPNIVAYSIFNSSSDYLYIYTATTAAGSWSFQIPGYHLYQSDDIAFAGNIYGQWAANGSGQAMVTAYDFVVGTTGSIVAFQGTSPWVVGGTVQAQQNGTWTVTASLSGGSATVTGTVHIDNTSIATSQGPATSASNAWPVRICDPTTQLTATVTNDDPDADLPGLVVRTIFPNSARGAFGGLIISPETPIVALAFNYNINSYFVVTGTAGGGTATQGNSQAALATTTSTSGSASLESRFAVRYNPGQGISCKFTAIFTAGSNGVDSIQEIGIGDLVDGFFFAVSGTNFGVIRRQNGVDTFISQSAWNGPDRYDGSGSSGDTIDITRGNVYKIQFQWLGYGAIRFFIEDPRTGNLDLVHTIRYTNANTLPSIFNPTLPLHARVFNNGGSTNLTLRTPSMGAYIEGPPPNQGARGAATNSITVTTTELPVLSITNSVSFQGLTNRVRIKFSNITTTAVGAAGDSYTFRIRQNPILTDAAFADFDTTTSVAAIDVTATATSGGRIVWATVLNGLSNFYSNVVDDDLLMNPGDVFTLTAQKTAGGGQTVLGAVGWIELFSG